jgi:hypothetical protein
MARHFRPWLRRKLKLSGKTQHPETRAAYEKSNPQTAAPNTQQDALPPPYSTLDRVPESVVHQPPRSTGSESIEVLRARNPAARPTREDGPILRPPRHKTRPAAAVRAAASIAVIGIVRALDESDPKMVAAHTAQAVAVAVSTSRSYAAFVAAITAAEVCALLLAEDCRNDTQYDSCRFRTVIKNAISAATDTAIAADAGITPIGAWAWSKH